MTKEQALDALLRGERIRHPRSEVTFALSISMFDQEGSYLGNWLGFEADDRYALFEVSGLDDGWEVAKEEEHD